MGNGSVALFWGAGVVAETFGRKVPGPPKGPASTPRYTRLTLALFPSDEFWFSDGSISDKSKCADPGLMPLPDTGTGLDWSHLVDAARAFEGKDARPLGGGGSGSSGTCLLSVASVNAPGALTPAGVKTSRTGWSCDEDTPQGDPAT